MGNVSDELLSKFKQRMHFSHDSEDDNLKELLSLSVDAVKGMVGDVDVDSHSGARQLVIERTRYAYNEALEFFQKNFSDEITTVQISVALEEETLEGDSDATI